MNAKHTLGPWTWFKGNANGKGLIRIESSCDARPSGIHISSLTRSPENEANAALIAAAPELLEACNAYIRYLQAKIDSGRFKYAEAQLKNQCLAAIAKAEGR